MLELIETRTSEKQLPADSSPLNFNCVCGRDYGSIQFLPKQRTRKINRERLLGRAEPDRLQISKRSELTQVDYSLRNATIAISEEELLDKATKVLAELRRNGWQFLPFSGILSEEDRAKLETYVSELKSRVEARKLYELEIERKEPLWYVTEEVGEIDPSINKIMKELSKWVATDLASSDDLQVGREKEKEKEESVNNPSNNIIIKWNPILMIRKYRHTGDPFRHRDFPMDFYAKVAAKYGLIKILSKNEMELLKEGFNIIDKYRRQFYDRNYRYTWFEWFWIARYAQAFSPRRAAKMLLVLDEEEQRTAGGRLSPKHIKDNINPVIQFWKDYFCYTPYFFSYLKGIHRLIDRDPNLKAEYNKILEVDQKDNDDTINRMLKEHLNSLQQKLLNDKTSSNVNNNDNYYLGTNNDDFKAVKIGTRAYSNLSF